MQSNIKKAIISLALLVFCFHSRGQTKDSLKLYIDLCGCNALSQSEDDSISKLKGEEELDFYFSNGKIKYKEFWKKDTHYTICYYPSGKECSEQIQDFKRRKEEDISYDIHGKKWWVCKGTIKF
ncbi:MAG TPA: hypothetical protein VN922_19210 [Bacteroidia bacterium]|nr:hypothetical protein [Bacteroidia bacterium]